MTDTEPSRPVFLADYAPVFQQTIPGAELRPDYPRGVVADWHIRVTLTYDRAPSHKAATEMVTQLAEQMRVRAIRELGLEPMLEAQRAEVRAFQQANRQLQATCDARASRIADLEERLAETCGCVSTP
jgi:hypothetical protein